MNVAAALAPRIPIPSRQVPFDFPGVTVGVAEYDEGPTGCTVVVFERMARVSIDVRHGMPGAFNPAARFVDAICLAGGSIMGLSASAGVAEGLYDGRGRDPLLQPIVSGGVLYDLAVPDRAGAVYPDAALGRAAVGAAVGEHVPVGAVGAGRSATCGKLGVEGWGERGGQGAAFATVDGVRILVLVVVNSLGVIVDRDGRIVRGNRDPASGARTYLTPEQMVHGTQRAHRRFDARLSQATTLTVVVTDARLGFRELDAVGRQVHTSLARAIQPFHTMRDGDILWAVTTDDVAEPALVPAAVGSIASELAWDAVLTSFPS